MRIIGGKYRGRRIDLPTGFRIRPTTDFARESLFNILDNIIDFEETFVLDLFAGTGSIGYEFSSRGAAGVHLVEQNRKNVSGIKKIIGNIGFENIKVVHIDVRTYLKICKAKYDVVFADPPYNLSWLEEIPALVTGSDILKPGGLLIIEHPAKVNFRNHELFFDHRNYGGVNFSFFRTKQA
ncbi:MAG TPA: 16S rRNA (guanine(966)-N(2))-methyltransferase RsmD [Bacteroidales bacterium]|nr:16S rRNA (guanine(966)-N(2))-methyltransferase RsmD [Bacteroidales bacterium]HQH23642.1 16S rRNA (guanine(966)-N(2))-methyltransferase RsmD [Bacteroidales bacterium]HQJ81164.1 16S rRNA (guanine(966)-N(2))-methyltransferase RsmD [Bacteroidales bacterium]